MFFKKKYFLMDFHCLLYKIFLHINVYIYIIIQLLFSSVLNKHFNLKNNFISYIFVAKYQSFKVLTHTHFALFIIQKYRNLIFNNIKIQQYYNGCVQNNVLVLHFYSVVFFTTFSRIVC